MTISSSRRLLSRISLSLFLVCTLLPPLPTFAQSSVVIGEIQWAGSETSSADEWIELWNTGNTPFSLNGFRLRGVGSGKDIPFGTKDIIPPMSAYLIANYHLGDSKTTLAIDAAIVTTTLAITNENSVIELIDSNGIVLDQVSWDKNAPGGSSTSPRSSMIRTLASPSSFSSDWLSSTTSKNLNSPSLQYGTPGICDRCIITASAPAPSSPLFDSQDATSEGITPLLDSLIRDALLPTEQAILTEEQVEELQDFMDASTAAELIDTPPSSNGLAPGDPDPSTLENVLQATTTPSETELSASTIFVSASSTSSPSLPMEALSDIHPVLATTTVPISSMFEVTAVSTSTITPSTTKTLSTSTEATLPVSTPLPESITVTTNTSVIAPSIMTPTPSVRFNEILANPMTSVEWIELAVSAPVNVAQFANWTIRDSKRTLISLSNTQRLLWDPITQLLLISFSKGVLADKGTHLFLHNASGIVVDELVVPATTKNQSFARVVATGAEWKKTLTPTPGKENIIQLMAPQTKTVEAPKNGTPTLLTTSSTKKAPLATTPKKPSTKTTPKAKTPNSSPSLTNILPPTTAITNLTTKTTSVKKTTKTTATKSTPKKKVATSKKITKKKTTSSKEKPIQDVALADLSPMHASARVRVTGTVATLPRLLSSQTFVIQTDEGRGLYVYGNTKQTSPPFRGQVEITGTLTSNDDGLALHMYAADRWRLVDLEHAVQPHTPDLIAPAAEDAWSYVQLRGSVIEAKATRITLLHEGTILTVSIRPLVRYRAERLQKGDEIEVSGILDTRKDMLVILPRLAEEIRVIQSAAPKAAAPTATATLPPWLPLGVAGISVAATQGARRYWQYRREKILRLQARATAPSLPSPSV